MKSGGIAGLQMQAGSRHLPFEMPDYGSINYVDRVSCKDIICYQPGGTGMSFPAETFDNIRIATLNPELKRVVLLDCGVKANIIRNLLKRNVAVIRVPWNYDFNPLEYDGLFLSNGPGDPDTCDAAVRNIRKALDGDKPICGICMGNQLLAKAGGASIYKLKYGHRSHNQPVRMVGTEKCFITSQNHGYAVADDTLGADWEPFFVNMNDGTNEGIRHKTKPFFSAQFHPEACSGPTDTEFIFDKFVELALGSEVIRLKMLTNKRVLKMKEDIKKVLLLGSGALKIGEAGEFDYSGSQALKAIKEEGIRTVLINPNIATVQTSEGVADTVYFLPVTPFFVEKVIAKERPDGILLALAGRRR